MRTPRERSGLAVACALLAIGAAGGCAAMRPTETGFLSGYDDLVPTGHRRNWGAGGHDVAIRPPRPGGLDAIDSFYVEPVAWLAAEDDWLGPSAWRRETVSAAFEAALRDELGRIRPVVDSPGPGTATVRAAITDVQATRALTNAVISTFALVAVSNGGAAVEVEVVGPDGRRLAAVDGGSAGGMLDYLGYYLWSSHARTSVRRLAGEVRDALLAPEPPSSRDPVEEPLDDAAARVGLGPGEPVR